jgi:hypothetical protein
MNPWGTTLMNESSAPVDAGMLPLQTAAELQDHLMTATNDLERLQTLLSDACVVLFAGFQGASAQVHKLCSQAAGSKEEAKRAIEFLGTAVTALQFQDMASQLIEHTNKRLRSCAYTLAQETFGDDDEDGAAAVELPPLRPNPVTQGEMDVGSVELF